MFHTLLSRIAFTLFIILLCVGLILVQMIQQSNIEYQQEISQKLNMDLAKHIESEHALILNKQANSKILDKLFHNLMVTNPSIELYVLDTQGKILGFLAEEGEVKRKQIDTTAIKTFLKGDVTLPLQGDDPRNLEGEKIFSASEIKQDGVLTGYLYIVLASEQYQDIADMLERTVTLDSTLFILFIALLTALVAGVIIFSWQTKRLKYLSEVIQHYAENSEQQRYNFKSKSFDEIDNLGQQFNIMADKIDMQVNDLKEMDNMRREMVANVSHDLRTPLTALRGYLETLILQKDEMSDEDRHKYIEIALSQSKHLSHLVEELFELARLDSCESVVYAEPFSMCELVQDVVQKYQIIAEQKLIKLSSKLNTKTPLTFGDLAMMQRVLENLIENGIRHTPKGGKVNITVDVDSGSVVVKIADTGCGIPEADVPRIFERFYQQDDTRTKSHNSGLGLAIVQRILELHKSVIEVESQVNRGTTFTFLLAAK